LVRKQELTVGVVIVVVVLCAAVIGEWRFTGHMDEPPRVEVKDPEPVDLPKGSGGWRMPDISSLLMDILLVIMMLTALFLIGWLIWRLVRRRRPEDDEPVADPVDVPARDEVIEQLTAAVIVASARLRISGPPTDAVIAAWLALESAAAATGVVRAPAATPTEFTTTLMASTGADEAAVAELCALYSEARFSHHPLTTDHISRAQECLDRIAADLSQVTPA